MATANRVQPIPPPLLDRMEVIELPGYTPEEKLKIAMGHLIPRVLDQHGLSAQFLQIPEVVEIIRLCFYGVVLTLEICYISIMVCHSRKVLTAFSSH